MDHDTINERLMEWHDGALPAEVRREVEAHVAGCAECLAAATQWQRTARALFQAPDVQTSEAFVQRVMERIAALEISRQAIPWAARIRWLAPAVGLAGLLLLMLGPSDHPVSIETLLLTSGRDSAPTQLALASEPPTTDEVFNVLLEERR